MWNPLPDQPRLYRMPFRLQLLAGIGCFLAVVYALQFPWRDGLRIGAVGITIAGSAALLGILFGFVFCYPRIKRAQAAAEPQGNVAVEDNSSLADISDWLTKIIVGVGLVELNKIPPALAALSRFFAPGLQTGPVAPGSTGQVFALALLLYFFPLGFMFGFIWTRFYYQEALKGLLNQIRASDLADQAAAKMDEGRLDLAMAAVSQALALDPNNAKALFVKGRILKQQAYSPSSKTYDSALLQSALVNVTQAAALLPGRASPLYNMACYQALLGNPIKDVVATLRRAFVITPALSKVAAQDDDLQQVRNDPAIKSLIAEFITRIDTPPAASPPAPDNPTGKPGV